MAKIIVKEIPVSVIRISNEDYISLTDMLKAKDGEYFFSNWLKTSLLNLLCGLALNLKYI